MDGGPKETASRCIELIQRHIPLNHQEERLLATVVNDIRVEFGLDGAVSDSLIGAAEEQLSGTWFW